jgi:hypothetical protein
MHKKIIIEDDKLIPHSIVFVKQFNPKKEI